MALIIFIVFFPIYSDQWRGLVQFQLQICHVQQMISLSLQYHLNPPFSYSLVRAARARHVSAVEKK